MRSKAPLVLMEQLIMLVVFSIAAAICVRTFVYSDQLSLKNELRDQALVQAQTLAETYKYYKGDAEKAMSEFGGNIDNNTWVTYWNSQWQSCEQNQSQCKIEIAEKPSDIQGLGKAEVSVFYIDEKVIFNFELAWQEE